MIVGVTGLPCSGGGSFAQFLVSKGFEPLSYSDILRAELREMGREVTREAMQDLGNAIRSEFGAGELSKRLLAHIDPKKRYVLTTIRNPAEVEVLRGAGDFVLVHVNASPKIRFERMVERAREQDPMTYEMFVALDRKELGDGQPEHGLRISDCIERADFTLLNDGSLAEFEKVVEGFVQELGIN
jgi:dephospho-CoA kinase